MRRARAGLLGLALAVASLPAHATAASRVPDGASFVPHQLIVRFEATASAEERARALAAARASTIRAIRDLDYVLVRTGLPVREAVEVLGRLPSVASAEPNYTGAIAMNANDPCINGCGSGKQWNVAAVNAPAGWGLVPGTFYTASAKKALTARVKVAVLDTKIEESHPDWINAQPLPVNKQYDITGGGQLDTSLGADIVPPSRQSGSADYHGTFVAGILGAAANNGSGVAGLGYHADLIPVTVVDGGGVVRAEELAQGIMHARAVGARVINLSLGLFSTSAAVQDAIDLATQSGALVVAAAGNNGNSEPFYPAWHRNAMAVAGVDRADRHAPCSNFSGKIAIAAPGMNILSLDPRVTGGTSVAGCGTSTATPHVSALAALLFAQDPSRTPAQVRDIITATADDDRFIEGRDDFMGAGRINFERALRFGQPGPVVDRVIASIPRALGGQSEFTASATATASRPILEAEWFIGALGAPGTGGSLGTADGTWGGTTERLSANVSVPLTYPSGVHRLFIRARDAAGWGAASVGVLIIDRVPPKIESYSVSPVALGTAGQAVSIQIEASDDHSQTLTYSLRVEDELTDRVVYTSPSGTFTRATTVEWLPGPAAGGMYQVEVTVRDDGDNPARARARTIVL